MRLRNIPRANEVIANSPMVIQEPEKQKGAWRELFKNDHPIHIEVGMGKGKFLTELAARHPKINYIGIERYTSVLLRAVEKLETQPENLCFICMDARELPEVFAAGEVDKIYLNFSDPWPKDRHAARRLPSRQFLERYDRILVQDGVVEFKTDNRKLFDFALEEVGPAGWKLELCTYDLHKDAELMKENIMTEYEEKFSALGNPICKMVISRERRTILEEVS
ncbi:MAG: tRNA (guanosine(46)-N7)-methyltransferase TrmB [Eubacteriales bacterium]|nr:tRNA (guanosine(46)-N7)-methyltransferase TrmB [Eubacteriales bacterium]